MILTIHEIMVLEHPNFSIFQQRYSFFLNTVWYSSSSSCVQQLNLTSLQGTGCSMCIVLQPLHSLHDARVPGVPVPQDILQYIPGQTRLTSVDEQEVVTEGVQKSWLRGYVRT